MSLHQIIYTSCKRGMDGVNDGQQVYSYDSSMTDQEKTEVRPLFTYTQPKLEPGQEMTDELARTMPQSFTYAYYENGDCAFALNTYLGRDYMGEGGRFGNHLAHVIEAKAEDVSIYPCEMIGSRSFRSSMDFDEVNSTEKPPYLPTPVLDTGNAVSEYDTVDFILEDENREFFISKMIDAMLRVTTDKKRVVICDTTENIRKWISALNYVLPVEIARKIGFTTYTSDPSLSHSQICGVISRGTEYNADTYCNSGNFFVFDFLSEKVSPDEYNETPFLKFIVQALTFDPEQIRKFNNFLINNTSYRNADTELYAGYDLYCLVTQGIKDISEKSFDGICEFISKYCNRRMGAMAARQILGVRSQIASYGHMYIMKMLHFLLSFYDDLDEGQKNDAKALIIDQIMNLLASDDISQEDFNAFYDSILKMARSIGLSIESELIKDNRTEELRSILFGRNPAWKIYLVLGIFCGYVRDSHGSIRDLSSEGNPGSMIYKVIKAVYAQSPEDGVGVAVKVMQNFAQSKEYIVGAAMVMEDDLTEIGASEDDIRQLWKSFYQMIEVFDEKDRQDIFEELADNEKYEAMFIAYEDSIEKAPDLTSQYKVFDSLNKNEFRKFPDYKEKYQVRAIVKYSDVLANYTPQDREEENKRPEILRKLAHYCMRENVTDDIAYGIIDSVISGISLYRRSPSEVDFIKEAGQYYLKHERPIEDYVLIHLASEAFRLYSDSGRISRFVKEIGSIAGDNRINIRLISDDREKKRFIKDMTDWPVRVKPDGTTLAEYYGLFKATQGFHKDFFDEIIKAYSSRKGGEIPSDVYSDLVFFLSMYGKDEDIDEAGAAIRGMKPEQIEKLDKDLKTKFKDDEKSYETWKDIRDASNTRSSRGSSGMAESFSSILNRLRRDK